MTMPRAVLSLLFITFLSVWSASAQTTEFTYQGSLKDGGGVASGNYDFQFALFNAASGGAQLGSTLAKSVTVSEGIFSVNLDFGNQFDGSARFLEIRVRNSGAANFTTLTPRQPVNSTPHAVKALSAGQLNGVDAGQYVVTTDPRLANDRNPTPGSFSYIQNGTAFQSFSNFYVGDARATNFNADEGYKFAGERIFHIGPHRKQENLYFGVNSGNAENGVSHATFLGYDSGKSNDFGNDNSFFGYHAGRGNTGGNNNSIFGSLAGPVSLTGNNNAFFGYQAGLLNTTGSGNTFFGSTAGNNNTVGANNTMIGFGANVGLQGLNFATAIGAGSTAGFDNSVTLGRDLDTVRVPGKLAISKTSSFLGDASFNGNVNITGTLTAGSLSANSISGIIGPANGGTGLGAVGAAGTFLRSDGTNWTASVLQPGDIVGGSANYVQNGTSPQASSNFNISGNGTVGGTVTAATVNATGQFNLGGSRFLSGSSNNLFAGINSGSANTGSSNTFVGANSGQSNAAGSNNTLLGTGANVGSGGLNFATAVGAGATVNSSNSLVLGRNTDSVSVPGALAVAGNTSVGGNLTVTGNITGTFAINSVTGILPAANGGTGIGGVGSAGNFLRSNGTVWQPASLTAGDIPNLAGSYIQNGTAAQAGNFNVTGNGTIGGNLTVAGTLNATVPAANITGPILTANGGTGLSGSGSAGNYLRSNGTSWALSTLQAGDLPAGSANYIQNGNSAQTGNFNISGNGTVGGNLAVGGTLTASAFPAANLTGSVSAANGGTGLAGSGSAGNYLRSNGTTWALATLQAGDIPNLGISYIQNGTAAQTGNFNITGNGTVGGNLNVNGTITGNFTVPAGSSNYIQNGTSPQSSTNFNISGNGTAGGTLSAATVNAANQFNLGGNRVLSNGNNNLFVGTGAAPSASGTNNTIVGELTGNSLTSGTDNVFVGFRAGFLNVAGSSNTVIGSNANLSSAGLSFASAIGANSVATANDTIVIGKIAGTYNTVAHPADSVLMPGTLTVAGNATAANLSTAGMVTVATLGMAGSEAICRNASNQIATCSSSARYKYNINSFGSGLDIVRKLRPVSFNWKADGKADMGLVAEEVAAAEPLLVNRNAAGQVEGVKYDRVGVVLLNAVKEQQAQIESLQKEVNDRKASEADLKDKLSKQQYEIDALKKLVCAQNSDAAICRQ